MFPSREWLNVKGAGSYRRAQAWRDTPEDLRSDLSRFLKGRRYRLSGELLVEEATSRMLAGDAQVIRQENSQFGASNFGRPFSSLDGHYHVDGTRPLHR